MPDLPSGTVTFLFTDIEGSTALWERDRAAMRAAVDRQLAILHSLIAAHHGVLYKTVGDGTQAAFGTAEDALRAALASQRALLAEDGAELGPLQVRMALHAGEAIPDAHGDYLAAPLNRLSRLLAVGHGGQILLSQTVQQLTRGALPAGSELRDLGEHRLRDLLEPERVYQLLHPDLPAEFPPLKSLENRPNNLPLQPTPFLGREREVQQIVDLQRRPDVRFLTLTGPGGTGKTRLALQAAAELLDDFAAGVYFVPLASLADPSLVLASMATTLGIREEGGQPLGERLRDFLAAKQLLLLLDNMEHLVAAAPAVAELLGTSPGLKVLATSRMPLRLRAEREYAVPPLGLPRRKPPPTAEQLSQYEAVRLFIERAQAVKADFTIDNATAPAVAEICHRLDGLPLAIELAAARVRMLPPQAMLARLEQRLPMLTSGARDAPERQRTLRNTIAWSYDLLEPEDQVLFRRLAVFEGGATFEAIESVGNHDGSLDAFGGVERLCEHSLLRQEADPGGEPRFTMLETVREFGLEQLKASGEEPAIRDAHMGTMLALADLAAPHLEGGEQGLWKTRLEADVANLRAAIGWLRMQGRVSEILHLGAAVKWFWCTYHAVEAGQWLEAALADAGNVSWDVKADALHAAGHLARFRADIPRATELHGEELKLRQAAGDEAGLGRLLLSMGMEATERGDPSAATPYLKDALDRLRGANDAWAVGITLVFLGHVARLCGDLKEAARHFEEAAQTQRGIGDTYHLVLTLNNLAGVRAQQGKFELAQEHSLAALTIAEDAGLDHSRVTAFGALADIAITATNLDAAEEYLLKALEISQAIGDEADTGDTVIALGALHHRRGNDQAAIAYLQQGLELVRSAGISSSTTFCLEAIAVIAADRGMIEPAARLLGAAAAADPGAAVYRYPSEQASYERVMALSRSMLGEAAFTTALEAGQGLPASGALTEMLDLTNQWAHEVVPA